MSSEAKSLALALIVVGFAVTGIDAFANPDAGFPTFSHVFGIGIACGSMGFVFGKYGELSTSNDKYETTLSWLGAGFLATFAGFFAFLIGALPVVLLVGILS